VIENIPVEIVHRFISDRGRGIFELPTNISHYSGLMPIA
jgi:hypothetical protein